MDTINTSTMNVGKFTHKVEVVRIDKIYPHENADALSKVKVYDYTCLVRTANWREGDLAAFIPPDSVVSITRPEFSFLAKKAKNGKVRIRTEKLRGIVSYGLLVPAPTGSKIGDDVANILEVEHWEPEISNSYGITGGEASKAPSGVFYTYDVDSFQRWGREVFIEGEPVVVSEKINGCNGRYVYQKGEIFCGSRNEWKAEYPTKPNTTIDDLVKRFNGDTDKAQNVYRKIENWNPSKNLWWIALENTPTIKDFCEANPNFAIYGEVYGAVGGWDYGVKSKYQFAAFDILRPDGSWLDFQDFIDLCKKYNVPSVPIIEKSIPFDLEKLVKMADRNSTLFDHIAEGIVIHPLKERWNEKVGRVKFKIINPNY